jgi:putative aminopeptidase
MPSIVRLPNVAQAAVLAALAIAPGAAAQSTPHARALAGWIGLAANPGYERYATDRIVEATGGQWRRDDMGNLVRVLGSGSPRRVIACGIDEPGYVVSEITDDGYLRVHGAGNGRRHALWDQFHEGQRTLVLTTDRADPSRVRFVPGVFGVRSTHLWRRRGAEDAPASIDGMWLDVGARSRADIERLGIRMLDPVVREWPAWTYGDLVAGPAAGDRAGCAAIGALAAGTAPARGQTVLVISAQSTFTWAGLTATLARTGPVDTLVLLASGTRDASSSLAPVPIRAPFPALRGIQIGTTLSLAVPVTFFGTLVESVREQDLASFFTAVARAAGVERAPAPVGLTAPPAALSTRSTRDSLSRYADLLGDLTDVYAVSGHETPMRDAVLRALPGWARPQAVVDSAGNIVVAFGPDRDTVVFVAHMDEVGYEVTGIARDGTVSLRTRGGFFPSLFEGQTALLHRPGDRIAPRDPQLGCGAARDGPLRGIFVPRDTASRRQPAQVTAWFGLDSAALVAAGARVGSAVTSYKCSARFAATRFSARSIDDRAGSAALILALDSIVPARLTHKVIFAWVVREETGLEGARALATQFGPSVRRVHAVDTFVSSESPLESSRFAHTPIGDGAVVRALDNSSVAPPQEIDRLLRIARASGIPVQVGTTNGGNDGSELARYGAVNTPLSWPLRYSHSPAEVIDLRDLKSLARLIAAAARD